MSSESWLQSGLTEPITLPSGHRVRGVLPTLRALVRADMVPSHLLDVALKGIDPAWLAEAETNPERSRHIREYTDVLVASFPRLTAPPGSDEWTPVTMTPGDIINMDPRDVDAIEDLVFRLRTPEEVTNGVPVPDLDSFRDEHSDDTSGAGRTDAVRAPEPVVAGGG